MLKIAVLTSIPEKWASFSVAGAAAQMVPAWTWGTSLFAEADKVQLFDFDLFVVADIAVGQGALDDMALQADAMIERMRSGGRIAVIATDGTAAAKDLPWPVGLRGVKKPGTEIFVDDSAPFGRVLAQFESDLRYELDWTGGESLAQNKVKKNVASWSNALLFLPPTTRGDEPAMLAAVLESNPEWLPEHSNEDQEPAPEWVEGLDAWPELEAAQQAFATAESGLSTAQKSVSRAEQELAAQQRWTGLIYAQGGELERLVNEALNRLDIPTELTAAGGRQDLRLETDEFVLVVEVGGFQSVVPVKKGRHRHDWVADEQVKLDEAEFDKPVIGAVIASGNRLEAPTTRGDQFSSHVRTFVGRFGYALIPTTELFALVTRGETDAPLKVRQMLGLGE